MGEKIDSYPSVKAQLKKSYWAGALLKMPLKTKVNPKQNLTGFHLIHPNKFQPRKHVP